MGESNTVLEMNHIAKHFGGVCALEDVSFELWRGEVHALVGENGAGKSTLIKVLMGIHLADKGEIVINGKTVHIKEPTAAAAEGVSAVFQELAQIQTLTVAENVYLTHEATKCGGAVIDRKTMMENTTELLEEYNMHIRAEDKVENLTIAQAQMAEIIKCIARDPKIIILDEPTSSLTKFETNELFNIIRRMKAKNVSFIYISHRMDEIFEIADRITILRDGRNACTMDMKDATLDLIVKHMVGREMDLTNRKRIRDLSKEDVVLSVRGICQGNRFQGVSFDLHKGEILGFAGLVGAGRSELMQIIFGIDKCDSGEIYYNGTLLTEHNPTYCVERGIALVPENRLQQGLILGHSIENNVVVPILKKLARFGFVTDRRRIAEVAQAQIEELNIKTESKDKLAMFLSGGNQQKVVLGKWLATHPKVFILDEPTAGIDVQSKAEIRTKIRELSDQGVSIIFISSELPELLSIADRILVMNGNRIVAEMFEPTQEDIMTAILLDNQKGNGGSK